jgi:hypothetical protein
MAPPISLPGASNVQPDFVYALLDLTALGRQEDWEEPKGRAPVVASG